METAMLFFFLCSITILSPVLFNLIKHWTESDLCNHAVPFNEQDLETGPPIQIPCNLLRFKAVDKLHLFLNRYGCSFCEKWLLPDRAIFFYCDMRFCSDECRIERMKIDDTKDKVKKVCFATQPVNATGTLYIL